ncbi:hypothetical protein [Roseivivax sp. CAU 1753]
MRIWKMERGLVAALILAPALAMAEAHAEDGHGDDHMDGPVEEMMGISDAPVQRAINLSCRFDVECLDDEECQPTDYEVALTGHAGGLDEARMMAAVSLSDMTGDEDALGAFENGVLSLSGGKIEARFLLTITAEAARYTRHFADGPMSVSYLGACD